MTKKGSDHITLTVLKTTVMKLRAMKRSESWDELMLRFANRGSGCSMECVICGKTLEAENMYLSPSMLAKKNGWTEITAKGRQNIIGFICPVCIAKRETK